MSDQPIVVDPGPIKNPNETISIPASQDTNPATDYRLCEYNDEEQRNCRRTNTILALEAEYDTFVSPEMFWGVYDLFCLHEGNTYYYKDWLRKNIELDNQVRANESADVQSSLSALSSYFSNSTVEPVTFESLRNVFISQPSGFPDLVVETPQFFQCQDVGRDLITIDNLDRPTLNLIESTFTDDIHPLLADLTDRLIKKDEKIYCVDPFAFKNSSTGKLGVMFNPSVSEKYDTSKVYFFPFKVLTNEQESAVRNMCSVESEFKGEVVIVNL